MSITSSFKDKWINKPPFPTNVYGEYLYFLY